MALQTEYPWNGLERFIRHYSDENKYILQVETCVEYSDAIDLYPSAYTYEETDHEIEPIEDTEEMEVDTDEY